MSGTDRRDPPARRGTVTVLQPRPLRSFTPAQQRVLRALIEAHQEHPEQGRGERAAERLADGSVPSTEERHPDGGPTARRRTDSPTADRQPDGGRRRRNDTVTAVRQPDGGRRRRNDTVTTRARAVDPQACQRSTTCRP